MKIAMRVPLVVCTILSCSTLYAQVVFTFGPSLNDQATYSDTVSGITISLSSPNSNNGHFAADSDGNLLTSDPDLGPNSFQISFNHAVQITGYSIGATIDPTTGTFSLSRTGLSSTGNDLSQTGSFSINGTFTAAANQTITLTSDPAGDPGWSQIKSFTVTAIPEPAETTAAIAAVCGVAGLILRRTRK